MVALANGLHRRGFAVDVVTPMGGGPLRTALDRGIGQIDLAKRHTRTSPLALARILAERLPAGLLAPGGDAALAAIGAALLARTGTPVAVLDGGRENAGRVEGLLRRFLLPRAALVIDPANATDAALERCLAAFGLPPSLVP